MAKDLQTFGSVEFDETKEDLIAARQKGRIVKLYVNYTGQYVTDKERLALLEVIRVALVFPQRRRGRLFQPERPCANDPAL